MYSYIHIVARVTKTITEAMFACIKIQYLIRQLSKPIQGVRIKRIKKNLQLGNCPPAIWNRVILFANFAGKYFKIKKKNQIEHLKDSFCRCEIIRQSVDRGCFFACFAHIQRYPMPFPTQWADLHLASFAWYLVKACSLKKSAISLIVLKKNHLTEGIFNCLFFNIIISFPEKAVFIKIIPAYSIEFYTK